MRYMRVAASLVLSVTLVTSCRESALAPRGEIAAAEAAMSDWVERNPAGWTGDATSSATLTRPSWTPSCSAPGSNGFVSLRLITGRGDVELAFRCPIGERATAAELQESFSHAVPWNLLTGVSSPNWRFQAWLPLSSIRDGVTFSSPRTGVLEVRIQSTMSGIRAESLRRGCEQTIADAASPSGCTLSREHRVPLRMRFTMLSDLSALR
jgi:hypothetical protein